MALPLLIAAPSGLLLLADLLHDSLVRRPFDSTMVVTQMLFGVCSAVAVTALLLAVTTFLWWLYLFVMRDPCCHLPLPPGSFGLPLIGETLQFVFKGGKYFRDRNKRFGCIYKTHLFGSPTIRVSGAHNVRKILLSENNLVRAKWTASARKIIGLNTIGMSIGDEHKRRKRSMAQAFMKANLVEYAGLVEAMVVEAIDQWCLQGETVLVLAKCKQLTFQLASRLFLGASFDEKKVDYLVNVFEDFVGNIFSLPYRIPGLGLQKGLKARERIHEVVRECIVAQMSPSCPAGGEEHVSALKMYLNEWSRDVSSLTEAELLELVELATELLFAGHETLSSALCSMVFYLGKNKQVIDSVRSELKNNDKAESFPATFDYYTSLKYVDQVVRETLRLSPPVGGGFRTVLRTFELEGYQIPAGWTLIYSIGETHSNSPVFEQRDSFDPDRWMEDTTGDENRFHFVPFGGGSRTCLGKEYAKLVLRTFCVQLATRCDYELVNGEPVFKLIPSPHPSDGLPCKFRRTAPPV